MLDEYTQTMRELWLPETKSIRNSCTREVIGFITNGGFSFTLAHSTAVGYITIGCLSTLLSKKNKNFVLIRNTCSRQYRLAQMEVIV